MEFSDFGKKLTAESGILTLMADLGEKIPDGKKVYPLGGGNPAQIPEIEKMYRDEMERIMKDEREFEDLIGKYDGPQGKNSFMTIVAEYLGKEYGWPITEENVAICNGSQSACFYLFNLLAGTFSNEDGTKTKKKILFPLVPEYVGYADQGIEENMFDSIPARFEEYDDHTFKYFVDFEKLEKYLETHDDISAMCVSRPTNPTGNVLTDDEVSKMSALAKKYGIFLIVDNAYGLPWPNIIFNDDAKPFWNENTILSMSLSKIGLPSLRTGIIIARKEIVTALSNMNSIVSLASGSFGQAIAANLIKSGKLVQAAKKYVRKYYEEKNQFAQRAIHKYFSGLDYAIHKGEGSIFLWVLMRDLKISTKELYKKLKERGVVVVSGEYFFYGNENSKNHPHYEKCIRLNYAADNDVVEEGIKILSEVVKENC